MCLPRRARACSAIISAAERSGITRRQSSPRPGETVSLPANVYNLGKSTLRNVTVTLTGAGLFPTSSVFLGDIPPGEAGYGEMKVFIGMLSMTEGYTESYGPTTGTYTVTYQDDQGVSHAEETQVSAEIKQPVIEGGKDRGTKASGGGS